MVTKPIDTSNTWKKSGEMVERIVNISEKNKCFVFLPAKTASMLASKIFNNYNFDTFKIIDNQPIFLEKGFSHTHNFPLFENHQEYLFICSMRNPYARLLSFYGMNSLQFERQKFYDTLEKLYTVNNHNFEFLNIFKTRKPDFSLKFENLYESYSKIPFIRDSDFFKNGQFKKLFDSKPHYRGFDIDWRDYYDKDLADLVYYNNITLFDMFEYEKNSWKK